MLKLAIPKYIHGVDNGIYNFIPLSNGQVAMAIMHVHLRGMHDGASQSPRGKQRLYNDLKTGALN